MMILFVMLFIPARYGIEFLGQTLDTELSGAKFFALRVNPQSRFMYTPGDYYTFFFNPSLVQVGTVSYDLTSEEPPEQQLYRILSEVLFFVDSQLTHNFAMFHYEYDPLRDWLLKEGNRTQKIYDSGSFAIHAIIYRR